MTKKITLVVALCFGLFAGNAQNSQKAKALLDEVYNKVTTYDNIYVDFKYNLGKYRCQYKE